MKTVGEILRGVRLEKNLTLEKIEESTKIRKKFLQALEENNWQKLPSITYSRGFIKNYAEFLGLDSTYILSIFRRQIDNIEKQKVIPDGFSHPLNEPFFRLTPSRITASFTIVLILLFFFWLFGQYQAFVLAPKIVLEKPKENEVVRGEKVIVVGKTDPRAILTINGQTIEQKEGNFNQEISVSPGIVVLKVEATNKFGKKTELRRTIKVESP